MQEGNFRAKFMHRWNGTCTGVNFAIRPRCANDLKVNDEHQREPILVHANKGCHEEATVRKDRTLGGENRHRDHDQWRGRVTWGEVDQRCYVYVFYVFSICPGIFPPLDKSGCQADKYVAPGGKFLCILCIQVFLYEQGKALCQFLADDPSTVCLTSVGNPLPGYQEFQIATRETIVGQAKKIEVSPGAWFSDDYWPRYMWSYIT
jgi:hypothetical protein